MRTVNYDALAASAPLNTDAAIARDGSGESWAPIRKAAPANHWDAPPVCQPLPSGVENLRGRRVGRLVVVSYYGSDNGSRWLVRCACGAYETRRTKSVLNPPAIEAVCSECDRLRHLQDLEHALRTGKWPSGHPVDEKQLRGMKSAGGHFRLGDGFRTDLDGAPLAGQHKASA